MMFLSLGVLFVFIWLLFIFANFAEGRKPNLSNTVIVPFFETVLLFAIILAIVTCISVVVSSNMYL